MITAAVALGVAWACSILFVYGAGARSGYWRGVARGQYIAGREHQHIMAHALYGKPLPELDADDLDAAKTRTN